MWKNLDRSLTSMSSWNEEACVLVGHGQVAACGWIPRAQVEVAHLFPGGIWVGWREPDPWRGSWAFPGEGHWVGTRHFGRRRRSVAGAGVRGDRRGKVFSELGSRKRMRAGRAPSNLMPGLLSLLPRLAPHPSGPRNCLSPRKGVDLGGAASWGSLSCSHILSQRVCEGWGGLGPA